MQGKRLISVRSDGAGAGHGLSKEQVRSLLTHSLLFKGPTRPNSMCGGTTKCARVGPGGSCTTSSTAFLLVERANASLASPFGARFARLSQRSTAVDAVDEVVQG